MLIRLISLLLFLGFEGKFIKLKQMLGRYPDYPDVMTRMLGVDG